MATRRISWTRRGVLRTAFGSVFTSILAACQRGGAGAPEPGTPQPGTPQPDPGMVPASEWVQKIVRRPAEERGSANLGWLDTRYSFSFFRYQDPAHMGFRALRVINEDWISAGGGFPMHAHRDMEIITYVLEGALEHKDSTGRGGIIQPGKVQWMSAGEGIRHSEFNPSATASTHLLQIWIHPDRTGYQPTYDERIFSEVDRQNQLRLVASPDGREGSIRIRTDTRLFASILSAGKSVRIDNPATRHIWLQIARGELLLNGQRYKAGDGAAISEPGVLEIRASTDSEFLLFDLA